MRNTMGAALAGNGAPAVPAASVARPRIAANRTRVDDRDPSLGFTIDTAGLPYFEVLLTTDRKYFDPQNAAGRTSANFYASRQDSGLIRATGQHSVYLVPAAVLRGFARAQPRPGGIYYTAVAYARQDGSGPAFAQAPETLTSSAPAVTLAADFKGHTLASVLGVPVEKLRLVAAAAADDFVSDDTGEDIEGDMGEGEDGFAAEAALRALSADPRAAAAGRSERGRGDPAGRNGGAPASATWQPAANRRVRSTALDDGQAPPSDGYDDDGFDDDVMPEYAAQGSAYGAGAQAAAFSYSDGYDDEASLAASDQPATYGRREQDPYTDGYDEDAATGAAAQSAYDDGYEDAGEARYGRAGAGYGDEDADRGEAGWAQAASVAYPAGAAEPAQLEDDYEEAGEDNDYDPIGSEFAAIQSLGAGAYQDEAASWGLAGAVTAAAPPAPLTIEVKLALIEQVAPFESGADRYAAVNRDDEFAGRIANHPAKGLYHIGLSYGIVQFTQDSGSLGRLLAMMRDRDPQTFAQIFGPSAGQLVSVTNAPGPESRQVPGGRSARVQPVDGADLWEPPWLKRFVQAGSVPAFQAAQNELAAGLFLDPMLQFAGWLGLNTDRSLAMVFDRAVQMGLNGAKLWIAGACCPVQTAAQRQQALAALGHQNLLAFQAATPGLVQDGLPGPNSDAALTAALRGLGAASPIAIPSRDQMLDAMVRRAASEAFAARVAQLRQSHGFADVEYQIP